MPPFVGTALAVGALMAALWATSIVLRDVSIVDPAWGPGFVLLTWVAILLSPTPPLRSLLIATMISLWGLRLGGYLLWRNWGKGEDYRYAAMRTHHGPRFWWVSAFTVFLLQGVLMWFVALPAQVAIIHPGGARLGWFDGVGAIVWLVGLGFETVGDWQLARFKANPRNAGKVMDRGLWGCTRHPNYFGDFLVWWGVFIVATATPFGPLTVLSPVAMSVLLMRVSGVTLLERTITTRRPAYRDYAARVNAFFPGPRRSA